MPETERHIVAIGGLLPNSDNLPLFQYLLNLANKPRPTIGFIATASGDAPAYLRRMSDVLGKLDCRPSDLPLFDRTPELHEYIAAQDVILVGGGNAEGLLAVWREWGLPEILRRAWHDGKVLAGWSAGAICWFEQGVTDSFADQLRPMECLGFLPGSCCPHYTGESDRRPAYHELIRQQRIKAGIALDDGGALHFRGSEPWRVIAPTGGIGARRVRSEKDDVVEEPLLLDRIEF